MGLSTAGKSAQPTASAKRRRLPGHGFAALTATQTADFEVQHGADRRLLRPVAVRLRDFLPKRCARHLAEG